MVNNWGIDYLKNILISIFFSFSFVICNSYSQDILYKNFSNRMTRLSGKQPDFGTAMLESLAYVDNHEITDWYVRMFLGSDSPEIENENFANNDSLIYFENSESKYRKDFFWETFKKVAGNPIGRNLLYRILIEEKRNGLEYEIEKVYKPEAYKVRQMRNGGNKLAVNWSTKFSINPFEGKLFFNDTKPNMQVCMNEHDNYFEVGCMNSNIEVDLFHELLHWYHALRHPLRYYDEKLGFEIDLISAIKELPICKSIWKSSKNSSDEEITNNIKIWKTVEYDEDIFFDLEEIRTIVGINKHCENCKDIYNCYIESFLNGDELCENMYRCSVNLPLRCGYKKFNFYEDKSVIELYKENIDNFIDSSNWDFLSKEQSSWDQMLSPYDHERSHKCIGSCKIPSKLSVEQVLSNKIKSFFNFSKSIYQKFSNFLTNLF